MTHVKTPTSKEANYQTVLTNKARALAILQSERQQCTPPLFALPSDARVGWRVGEGVSSTERERFNPACVRRIDFAIRTHCRLIHSSELQLDQSDALPSPLQPPHTFSTPPPPPNSITHYSDSAEVTIWGRLLCGSSPKTWLGIKIIAVPCS